MDYWREIKVMKTMLLDSVIVNKNFCLSLMPELNVIFLMQNSDFSLQYHDLSLRVASLSVASEIHAR